MNSAFEIARVSTGLVVVVLNKPCATAVHTALVQIKAVEKYTPADRALMKKLEKEGESVVLEMDDDKANRFCDLLESGLTAGMTLERAVYALGERLAHRLSPGCYFGPREQTEAA